MTTPPRLPPRYAALGVVGEGATGTVWKAHDHTLGATVALKIVHPNLAIHARFRARFAREVAISASMRHPHIVPVLDHGRLADGRPFVSLAYANQGSLSDLLRREPPMRVALAVLDQVLAALAELHARGLVHQDLKPENVLLHGSTEAPDTWVADLGAAGALSELAMDHRGISGTPRWMAPEQLLGRAQELGPWTDLYAVGLLLAEVLGAERGPLPTRKALLERRLVEPVRLPDHVPAALREVVAALLDPEPRQRYDRAADARRVLAHAAAELDPDAAVTGIPDDVLLARSTTFPEWMLDEGRETLSVRHAVPTGPERPPTWHRVLPDPPPREPPTVPQPDRQVTSSLALLALRDAPLVGREGPLRLLWDRARYVIASGQPQVALVVGRAGTGKSRVVEALARQLDVGGWMESVTLRFHDPPGADDGYRGAVQELLVPWNDTRFEAEQRLSRWLARDHDRPPSAVAGEAAVLARWCGYNQDHEQPVNAAVGLAFLYRHLDARAWRGGACLVLEDAHLAQVSGDGLAICEALLERAVGERPVLVVATLSQEALDRDLALADRVRALEERGAVRVPVSRLRMDEAITLLVEGHGLAPALARRIAPHAHGNLTFLTLAVRDLAARGQLVRDRDGGLVLRPGAHPATLSAPDLAALCLQRVVGALKAADDPDAVGEALASTALAGPEPPVQVVRAINQEGLDGLVATGLVRQSGRRLVFEHRGIYRAALEIASARPDCAALHRRIADAWEELGRVTGADVTFPHGAHRLHAVQPDRAVVPLLQAARTALRAGLPHLARQAAELAVQAGDGSGILMARAEARQRLAEAWLALERPEQARRAIADTRRLGKLDRLSRARLKELEARAVAALGDGVEAHRLLASAGETFEAIRDWSGLVRVALEQGALARSEGHPERAIEHYERALALDRGGDATREVRALRGLVECRIAAGRLEDVERDLARMRQVARESGDTRNIAQSTFAAGLVHLRRRRLDLADRHFQTALALAATLGDDRLRLSCENNRGEVSRYRGDLKEAWRSYDRAARLAEGRGWVRIAAVARLNLALVAVRDRRSESARRQTDLADALLHDLPRHWGWMVLGLVRALLAAEKGDEARCRAWWAVARERGLARSRHPDHWLPLRRLGAAAHQHGWADLARQVEALTTEPGWPEDENAAEVSIEE